MKKIKASVSHLPTPGNINNVAGNLAGLSSQSLGGAINGNSSISTGTTISTGGLLYNGTGLNNTYLNTTWGGLVLSITYDFDILETYKNKAYYDIILFLLKNSDISLYRSTLATLGISDNFISDSDPVLDIFALDRHKHRDLILAIPVPYLSDNLTKYALTTNSRNLKDLMIIEKLNM